MPTLPAKPAATPRRGAAREASFIDQQHAVRVWVDKQVREGKVSAAKANQFWQESGSGYLEKIKSYFPIAKDLRDGGATLRMIVTELGVTGRYFVKVYKGRPHIVFKGRAGTRSFLTGTRYGAMHHKIISLKMTTAGMKAAAREGLIFGILFCTVIDIVDYVSNDRATLGQLFGTLGMDIAKTLVATGAAFAVGVGVAAAMGTAVVAIGPVIVALAVGVGLSVTLDWLDGKYGITKKLGKLCDEGLARLERLGADIAAQGRATWQQIERSGVVRDLSREARSWSDWIAERASQVRWSPGLF